MLISVYYKRMR